MDVWKPLINCGFFAKPAFIAPHTDWAISASKYQNARRGSRPAPVHAAYETDVAFPLPMERTSTRHPFVGLSAINDGKPVGAQCGGMRYSADFFMNIASGPDCASSY